MPKPKDFEAFLLEKHGDQYVGTDDMMVDDYNEWVQDLSEDDWIKYGNQFRDQILLTIDKAKSILDELVDTIDDFELLMNKRSVINKLFQQLAKLLEINLKEI